MALSENEKRRFENRYRGIADQNSDPFESLPDSVKARLYKRKSTLEKNAGDVPASKRKHIYSEFGTGVETEFRNNLPGLAQEYARKRAERERTLPLIGVGVYETMTGNNMPSLALEYAQERAAQGYKRPTLRDPEFAVEVAQNAYTGFQVAQRAMQESPSARSTAADYVSQRKPYSLRQTPYDQDLQKYAPQKVEEKSREKDFRNVGFYDHNNEFVRFDSLERQPDYNDIVAQSKRNGNPLEDYYNNPINRRLASMGKTDEDIISLTNNFDSASSRTRKYALMSDQERNNYNYIYGKAGKSAAEQYLDALQSTISQRGAAAQYAESKATPGLLRVPSNIGKSFEGGAKGAIEGFAALPDFLTGTAKDYVPKEHEYLQSMLLEEASWPEGLAYKAASAIGNMAPSIATGTIAGKAAGTGSRLARWAAGGTAQEAIFATQTAGQTYREDIMEGRPVEGAQTNAIFTAIDEAATNWLLGGISSLGGGTAKKLLGNTKVAKAAKQGISNALARNPAIRRAVMGAMNYGGDMLSEGTQEATQDFTEAIRKHLIYGDKLDLKGVATDPQTWEDFLLGAITAGTMNAPGAIANNVAINHYGKSIDHDYRDVAAGIDTRPESYATAEDQQQAVNLHSLAQEYAARQANKETISNRDKAEFELQLESFNYGAQARKKALDSIFAEDQEPPAQQNHEPGGEQPDAPVQRPTMSQNSPEAAQMREAAPTAQKVDSVAYNAPESNVSALEEWAKPFGAEGREAFKAVYDGETDLGAYYRAFGRAYNIGRYNMEPTPQQRAEAAVILGVDGFSEAFKAGVHDQPQIQYDSKTGSLNGMVKGAPKEGGLGTVAQSATEAQKKVATHIGKLTGLQIDLVDGLNNQNAAASYSKGKITLSVNSSDFMGSAAHELTHYIKDYAPDAYQVYSDHAVRAITEAQGVDLETMINDYISTYEQQTGQQLSREEAVDEIVADATQKFLNDPDFINRAIKEDSTIGQRIIDFLTDVIDAIKELVKVGSTRRAAKALEENLQYFEHCRQEWMTGLEEAGERYKAGWETETKAEPKYKLEKPDQVTDENIEQNYETVRNMEPVAILKGTEFDRGEKTLRDQVMDYYSSIGKVHNDVVGDIYLTKDSVKDDIAHGVGRAKAITFAAVPDILKQGKVLQYNKNWKDRGYDSIILGAPITIESGKNVGDYYGLAIVKVLDDNRLYLHEVYAQKMEANVPFKTPDLKTGNTRSGDTTLPSIYSIFGKLLEVNNGQKYYRFSNSETPMSEYGHAMFSENEGSVSGYGENEYIYDGKNAVPIESLKDLIVKKWDEAIENGMEPIGYENLTGEEVYQEFDPSDIVMSAQAWDNGELLTWFYENVALENDITAVTTKDGAIVFDENLIKKKIEEDISYQLEDVDNVDARALQQENKTLREANELLRRELELTGKTEPRLSDVKKVATELLRQHNSDYRHETLTRNLIGLYEYLRSADQVDMAQAAELAAGIAKGVLKKAKSTSEYAQQYEDLRQQIRDTKIQITDQDKADLMRMGGYNNFRKQYFGKMKLGNDGISIDAFYQELADQHPELFDANVTHPADQLMAVATAIDTMTAQVANPYGADMDEMSYIVGQEILQAYSKVREVPATFADKKAAELQQVRRDYNKKMAEYKNDLKKKYDQALKEVWRENSSKIEELAKEYRELKDARMVDRAEYRTKMERLRNDKNLALAAMQQRHREQLQQRRDSLRAREAKKRIIKDTREMHRWLTEPNDKKHVPESLRTPVAQFLLSIDFSSDWTDENGGPAQRTIVWKDISKQLNNIVEAGGVVQEPGEQRILNVDPALPEKINELADKVKLLPSLDELDANQLERLQESVTAMKKLIQDANQMISNANYRSVETAATSFLSDVSKKKDAVEFSENSYVGKGKNMFQNDLLDSNSAFYRMGPVMRSIYQEIRDAEDRHTANLVTMERYFRDTCQELGITKEELREWTGPKAKQMTFIVDGKAVKMTAAQLMTLYELDKRGQAKKHIYSKGGGIIPAELIQQKDSDNGKTKTSVLGRMNPKPKPVRVTEQDVQRITSVLTPKQIAFADKLQFFLGHVTSEWGNETSMKMYGYKKFTAQNYFPIEVYDNAIHKDTVDVGMNALASIKNIGAAKATSEKAGNALVLNDIMDVYIKHSNQMSIYNAMLAPLSDFQKVYNYKSGEAGNVKEEIERAWGKGGAKYLDTLIKDINGRVDNPDPGMYGKLMQNMKAAAVAGNLRVAIQQPTAMVRAAAELSLMDLGKGAVTKSPTLSRKEQWAVMCKYAPITQWKDWGFFKMDVSRSMRDVLMGPESKKQSFVDKTMWLAAKGDEWAWRRMWNACEYEVMRSNPELEPGSDAYYRKVGSRFSTVIDKTQVVDSVLHRTQIMRNSDGLVKMSVAFMNEPLKSYNMVYRAFVDAQESGNYKAVRTAAVIYAANAITTALAASLIDMIRDDDKDKKLWEKYLNALMGNAVDGLNPLNMIPLVKDIWSIFQGYSTKRTDLSGIEDIERVTGKWVQYFQGDSKYTIPYLLMETMDSTSIITGIPVRSLNRDITKPLIRSLYSVLDGDEYRAMKLKHDIGSEKNLGYYAEMMVDAMLAGDSAKMEQIKADMLEAGLEKEDISSRYDSKYKEYLKDNVPEIEEAAQARIDGNPEEYKRLYDDLVAAGYDPSYVKKAIDTATNKLRSGAEESEEGTEENKEEEPKVESIYSTYDLLSGVEQVSNTTQSLKAFGVVAEDMYQAKLSNGKKKSEAIGEIKSLITKAYKKQWIEAYQRKDKATYQAIQNKLKYLKIGGVTIYGNSDWENWLKEAKKSEKKK